MSDGISPNPLNDLSKIYLDQVAAIREVRKQETEKDIERWSQSAKEALQHNESVDATAKKPKAPQFNAAKELVQKAPYMKPALQQRNEGFSSWRTRADLREISDAIPETEKKTEKEVTEKKVKNTIKINPTLPEAVSEIGGELIEVTEYDPIEDAIEYLYEEGINEEGIDLLIEEIGLDGFVEFVEGGAIELNEARKARRANVKAKSYAQVKKEVDASDAAKKKAKKGEYAASYAKKETDVTVYDDKPSAKKKAPAGMKKAVARKKEVLKQPVKKAAPKPVAKKVVKAVAKVKKTQPVRKATKQGLASKITTAYKKGIERHKAARERGRVPEKRAKEFGKGFASGVKDTVKFAKKAKKAVVGEELTVTAADKKGNTPAWQGYKAGKKNVKTGKPIYKAADHVKEAKVDTGSPEAKASARNVRNTPPGKDYKFDTSVFITRKPGESLDSARTRKRREAHAKKRGVKEDKAFDNVVSMLRKKHGEGSVLTKDSPKPKPQPRQKPKPDTRTPEQKKKDQDHANVMARYGGEDNYKRGRGLGT